MTYAQYKRSLYNTTEWLDNVRAACARHVIHPKKNKKDKKIPPMKKHHMDSLSLCPSYITWKKEQKERRKLKRQSK